MIYELKFVLDQLLCVIHSFAKPSASLNDAFGFIVQILVKRVGQFAISMSTLTFQ